MGEAMKRGVVERRNPLADMTREEKIKIIEEAIDSWLEKKWAMLGKWTARGIAAAAFAALVYFIVTHGGVSK